jgi:hypothetical protein
MAAGWSKPSDVLRAGAARLSQRKKRALPFGYRLFRRRQSNSKCRL